MDGSGAGIEERATENTLSVSMMAETSTAGGVATDGEISGPLAIPSDVTYIDGFNVDGTVHDGRSYAANWFGLEYTPSVSYNIKKVELIAGEGTGEVIIQLRPDAGGLPSDTVLRQTSFTQVNPVSWQGAEFATSYPLTAGTTYWIVFKPIVGSQLSSATSGDIITHVWDYGGDGWDGKGDYFQWMAKFYEETGEEGPVVMAASTYGDGRAMVIGDGNLFDTNDHDGDGVISLYEYDNEKLAVNTIDWLCQPVVEQPDIWVEPLDFDVTLPPDTIWNGALKVGNDGSATLTYSISDVETTPAPGASERELQFIYQEEVDVSADEVNAPDMTSGLKAAYTWGASGDDPTILVYTDDYQMSPGTTYVEQALQAMGMSYTAYYGDYDGFGSALTTGGPWDMVLVSHNNYFGLGNWWTEIEDYVDDGGTVVIETFDIDGSHSEPTTLWTTLGVSYASDLGTPEPVYRWQSSHPIFTQVENVPDMSTWSTGYGDNGDKCDPMSPTIAVAGFTGSETAGEGALFTGSIVNSFVVSNFRGDDDSDGKLDAVELWQNEIAYSIGGPDCPWLDENPKTGDVEPGYYDEITVTIDTTGLATGEYSAEICISNNDPDENPTIVPVQLTVGGKPDLVIVEKWEEPAPPQMYLHPFEPIDPREPIKEPVETDWHELYPEYCNEYHLSDWEDNGDGVLSPCDYIVLTGETEEVYHVDEMTVTIFVSLPAVDQEPIALEFTGGYDEVERAIYEPICTYWHEIRPVFCPEYHLKYWDDNGDYYLSYCDWIYLVDLETGEGDWYHVEEVTWDIIVSPEVFADNTYVVSYTVHNQGDATAPAGHSSTLYIDGVAVEHKVVPVDLEYCETYTDTFRTVVECTPPEDKVTVCADNYDDIDESNERNNCLTNIWECLECNCGDVNCVNGVDMTDVILLYYNVTYYPDPTYTLASTWAGDVNCANGIDMTDVILLYYNVTYYPDPRYELTCCGERKCKE